MITVEETKLDVAEAFAEFADFQVDLTLTNKTDFVYATQSYTTESQTVKALTESINAEDLKNQSIQTTDFKAYILADDLTVPLRPDSTEVSLGGKAHRVVAMSNDQNILVTVFLRAL